MKSMQIRRKKESGQSLVEYGLILGLIVVGVIVILISIGPKIEGYFQSVDDALSTPEETTTGS